MSINKQTHSTDKNSVPKLTFIKWKSMAKIILVQTLWFNQVKVENINQSASQKSFRMSKTPNYHKATIWPKSWTKPKVNKNIPVRFLSKV